MRIGTRVIHKDYPSLKGTIVAKTQTWTGSQRIVLVRWDKGKQATSYHILAALKKVD